jgi:hypothetical protein
MLLEHGADATALDSTSNGVLQYAAFSAQTELIAPLLAAGADQHINRASRTGFTPLLTAVAEGHLHVARQLLRAGAVQGACGQKQPTELTVASRRCDTAMAALLLRHGALPAGGGAGCVDENHRPKGVGDTVRATALVHAVKCDTTLEVLLAAGMMDDGTALTLAVLQGQEQNARKLLASQSPATLRVDRWTPLQWAVATGQLSLAVTIGAAQWSAPMLLWHLLATSVLVAVGATATNRVLSRGAPAVKRERGAKANRTVAGSRPRPRRRKEEGNELDRPSRLFALHKCGLTWAHLLQSRLAAGAEPEPEPEAVAEQGVTVKAAKVAAAEKRAATMSRQAAAAEAAAAKAAVASEATAAAAEAATWALVAEAAARAEAAEAAAAGQVT